MPEHLKKYHNHLEPGFLVFGEASAKEQAQGNPATEPKQSQKSKKPLRFRRSTPWLQYF
jgi:hypothetical protein